jgi:hypothetical protein
LGWKLFQYFRNSDEPEAENAGLTNENHVREKAT